MYLDFSVFQCHNNDDDDDDDDDTNNNNNNNNKGKRSTLILMVGIFLNRSPLTHSAYSAHQLASSCVISVGKFMSTRGKSEKRALCFKDARCSCNVSMPYYFTTVYLPLNDCTG